MTTATPGAERVAFREGQVLAAADLVARQRAAREERWRHNREMHGFGIVAGLDLARANGLRVCPGLAYDQRGRELILPTPRAVTDDELRDAFEAVHGRDAVGSLGESLVPGSVPLSGSVLVPVELLLAAPRANIHLDVWLLHHAEYCPDPDGNGGRFIEGARLHYADHGAIPPTDPALVGVHGVFLGSVNGLFVPDPAGRVYIPAVGARVVAPSGLGRVLLAPESAGDPRRFAVQVRADRGVPLVERLVVEADGRARAVGRVQVKRLGGAHRAVSAGPPEPKGGGATPFPRTGLKFVGSAPPPEGARPWTVYHAKVTDPKTKAVTEELRVEVRDPGKQGSPSRNRFVIGTAETDAVFTPALTVRADKVVALKGVLLVEGTAFVKEAGGPPGSEGADGAAPPAFPLPPSAWFQFEVKGALVEVQGTPSAFAWQTDVTLHNAGPAPVTNLLVAIRIEAQGVPVPQPAGWPTRVVRVPGVLAPGAEAEARDLFAFDSGTPTRVSASVTVMGTAPDNTVLTTGNTFAFTP